MISVPRSHFFAYLTPAVVIAVLLLIPAQSADAATTTQRKNQLKVGATSVATLFDGKFAGGSTVATGDLDGDGVDEYIVGAGPKGGPHVEVYSAGGSKILSFFALDKKTLGGIYVAAADLDGNGTDEILVSPQGNLKPYVYIYSGDGTYLRRFLAFEASYTGGVRVAAVDARDGEPWRIMAASGAGRDQEVRFFDAVGNTVRSSWFPYGKVTGNGQSIAAGWSDTYGETIVVVGNGAGYEPRVTVLGLNSGKKLKSWLAYNSKVKTGIRVAFRNDHLVVVPAAGGGPEVKTFSMDGQLLSSYFAYEKSFRGGVMVAVTGSSTVTPVTVPTVADPAVTTKGKKKIVVDLSEQTLKMYEGSTVVSTRRVSTGKWSTPTPTGSYYTRNKITTAYSRPYALYMEYWMAFTADGSYGLHSLPYWKTGSGRVYEGAAHIGTPVSHGCIRQTVAEAKSLFDWAPIGTPVIITK